MADKYGGMHHHPIIIGGNKTTIGRYWQHLLNSNTAMSAKSDQWPMYGKSACHNFSGGPKILDLQHHWSQVVATKQSYKRPAYHRTRYRRLSHFAFYPIVANNHLFVNTGNKVLAFDLFSGKRRWQYDPRISRDLDPGHLHSAVYADGALYLNLVRLPTASSIHNRRSTRRYASRSVSERTLVKIDAKSGRLLWDISNNPNSKGFNFLSTPLLWGDYLYTAAAKITGLLDIYLLALNPDTGKIVYQTAIGSLNPRYIDTGTLCAGNGTIYYLTNLGVLCAIDAYSGRIRWLFEYSRYRFAKNSQHGNPLILHGDRLYAAPLDSHYLYSLDAATGESQWHFRSGTAMLLAVSDNTIILGSKELGLLNRDNGKSYHRLLRSNIVGNGFISEGHYFCPTTNALYCIDLHRVQATSIWRWPDLARDAGHILNVGGLIISASSSAVNVFYDFATLATMGRAWIANQEDSPLPYLQLAEIYAKKSDKLEQAISMYQKGLARLKSRSKSYHDYRRRFRASLIDVYQKLARQHEQKRRYRQAIDCYTSALKYADADNVIVPLLIAQAENYYKLHSHREFKQLLRKLATEYSQQEYLLPQQKYKVPVRFYVLLLLAEYWQAVAKPEPAVVTLQKIISEYPEIIYESKPARIWASGQIRALLRRFGHQVYAVYDEKAFQAYQTAKTKANAEVLLGQILSCYPNSRYAPQILMDLVLILRRQNKLIEAIKCLQNFLRGRQNDASLLPASYLLLECYEQAGMYAAAQAILEKFQSAYKGRVFVMAKQRIDIDSYVRQKLEQPYYRYRNPGPTPTLVLADLTSSYPRLKYETAAKTLRLVELASTPSQPFSDYLLFRKGRDLYCLDVTKNKELWRRRLGTIIAADYIGKLLLTWGEERLVMLAATSGNSRWTRTMPAKIVQVKVAMTTIVVCCRNSDASSIYVIELASGKLRWHCNLAAKTLRIAQATRDTLVLCAAEPQHVYVYNINTGRLLQQFPRRQSEADCYGLAAGDYLYIVYEKRTISCYRMPSFQEIWRYSTTPDIDIDSLTASDRYLCFWRNNKQLLLLDALSGKVQRRWQILVIHKLIQIVIDDQYIYLVGTRGNWRKSCYLYAIDANQKNYLWRQFFNVDRDPAGKIMLTRKCLVYLLNEVNQLHLRNQMKRWKTTVTVYARDTGSRIKMHRLVYGQFDGTPGQCSIAGKKLWLCKKNKCWVFEK